MRLRICSCPFKDCNREREVRLHREELLEVCASMGKWFIPGLSRGIIAEVEIWNNKCKLNFHVECPYGHFELPSSGGTKGEIYITLAQRNGPYKSNPLASCRIIVRANSQIHRCREPTSILKPSRECFAAVKQAGMSCVRPSTSSTRNMSGNIEEQIGSRIWTEEVKL